MIRPEYTFISGEPQGFVAPASRRRYETAGNLG
jgi:hypothetical protein